MNIWLIRHGQTPAGEAGRYQGFLDESLSEEGKAALSPSSQKPSHVYVSPAKRARETAAVLFPNADQVVISGLWEMNFGRFEGRTWQEMTTDPDYRAWVEGLCLGPCPGGESRAVFSERVLDAFTDILRMEKAGKAQENDLFIVAHGGTQMALLDRLGRPARDYYAWQRPCGCGWLLTWDEEPDDAAVQAVHFPPPALRVVRELSFLR